MGNNNQYNSGELRNKMRSAFEFYQERMFKVYDSTPECHLLLFLNDLQDFLKRIERSRYFDYEMQSAKRKRLGITQIEVARLAGCSRQYISAIEKGLSAPSEKVMKVYRSLGEVL